MVKVIIVDGIDCSGKDTVINYLNKNLRNSITIKNNYKPTSSEDSIRIKNKYEKMLNLIKYLKDGYDFIILNRWYPSELVYSGIKRDYDAFKDKWFVDFEKELLSLSKQRIKFIHLWVTSEELIIKQRMKSRGEDFINESEVKSILDAYSKFYASFTTLKVLKITSDIKEIKKFVESQIKGD